MSTAPSPPDGIRPSLPALIACRSEARRMALGAGLSRLAAGAGGHLSRRPGPGIEYAESRPYSPGDDPRQMDWRLTARAPVPHVKVWREERERPVWLVVDQGPGMAFGTRVAFKSVIAAHAAALLAWGALAHGDRVGGLVLTGASHRWQPPQRHEAGVLALLQALTRATEPALHDRPAGFTAGLNHLFAHPPEASAAQAAGVPAPSPGSLLVLLSDFADLPHTRPYWLARLGARADLVLVLIYDPLEAQAPPPGHWPVSDGSRRLSLDLTTSARRERWEQRLRLRREALQGLARRQGVRCLTLATDQPVALTLAHGLGLPVARER